MPDSLTLPRADDLHVHLRQGALMRMVVPAIRAGGAGRVLVMPNLKPPVATTAQALVYHAELCALAPNVRFLMTLYLTPQLTAEEIAIAAAARDRDGQPVIVAVKSYPRGVTTNSQAGVESYERYYGVFAAMQEHGLVLSLHGEVPSDPAQDICVLNAEERFLVHLAELHRVFPRLRIVLEHVTSAAGVAMVEQLGPTVAATITAHHLELTVDDWAGRNHHYCKPVAKYPHDRAALRDVLRRGHPRFFLGSDSAPHPRGDKETACACAGVYTQPYLLPYLASTCDALGCLDRLAGFASRFGAAFYGLPPQDEAIDLVRSDTLVPLECCAGDAPAVVPFRAGESLAWSLRERE